MSAMNHCNTRLTARLMLMLAVLQFVFVALEAAHVAHDADGHKMHHQVLLDDGSSGTGLGGEPGDSMHIDQCHGHCVHLMLATANDFVVKSAIPESVFSYECRFDSSCIHSIFRPPIV